MLQSTTVKTRDLKSAVGHKSRYSIELYPLLTLGTVRLGASAFLLLYALCVVVYSIPKTTPTAPAPTPIAQAPVGFAPAFPDVEVAVTSPTDPAAPPTPSPPAAPSPPDPPSATVELVVEVAAAEDVIVDEEAMEVWRGTRLRLRGTNYEVS